MPKFGMGKGLKDATSPENLAFGRKLGAGVDALFGGREGDPGAVGPSDGFVWVDPSHIEPNPNQPRKRIDPKGLESLAASIAERGLLQPLVVRRLTRGYELIAGERRWRACRMAGLTRVPVLVKETALGDSLILALIENVQREDLNPMEEAEALDRIKSDLDLTQEDLAGVVHKDRSTVANTLRLLQLPAELKADVAAGTLSPGHARALLSLTNPAKMRAVRNVIVAKGLSVRQAEALVKRLKSAGSGGKPAAPDQTAAQMLSLTDDLKRRFGTKVAIKGHANKGRIVFEYYSREELDRLLELLRD